jgi:hypothetical protein
MANGIEIEPSREISQSVRRDSMRKVVCRYLRKFFFTAVIASVLNFALFSTGTFYLGGNAIKGKPKLAGTTCGDITTVLRSTLK